MMAAVILACLMQACGPATGADGLGAHADDGAHPCDPKQVGLLITELMANPAGPDAGKEWLEVQNMADVPLCLDGAVLHVGLPWATKSRTLKEVGCLAPHGLWVLADGTTAPGEPPPYVVHHRYGAMAMPNAQGTVAISCQGEVLTAVEYGTGDVPAPVSGRSLARVPMAPWGRFCVVAGAADMQGNVGSPGVANPGCKSCIDGSGALRAVTEAPPAALTLRALHVALKTPKPADGPRQTAPSSPSTVGGFARPSGLPWGQALLQAGDEAVDLAGFTLEAVSVRGKRRIWRVPEGQCHTVAPGASALVPLHHHLEAPVGLPAWLGTTAPFAGAAHWTLRQGERVVTQTDGRLSGAAG